MTNIYFEDITGIGNLYLDKVLNKFEDENIIFICKNDSGKYYFCICYEFRYELSWIITEIKLDDLLKVLIRNVDMYSIYKNSSSIIQVIYNDNMKIITTNYENIEKNLLPTEGVVLNADEDTLNYIIKIGQLKMKENISVYKPSSHTLTWKENYSFTNQETDVLQIDAQSTSIFKFNCRKTNSIEYKTHININYAA
ncbi:MAG: DUF6575 domain-containing protein [Faecalimonas sp.]|nr:DUF6575 domain-containing protein [Faecalimonas sp.]